MDRKTFIKSGVLGLTGLTTISSFGNTLQETASQVEMEKIKEFVIAGHGNLEKVKTMLTEEPNLLYSRYDWGGGDFEEAIEGAGHVGNKEIANYLIGKGARVNLFVLTLLGKKDIVLPTLEAYPELVFSKGPHGFSLLHHAEQGGEDAVEILNYLTDKGLKETRFEI